jgi:hypothetical protein
MQYRTPDDCLKTFIRASSPKQVADQRSNNTDTKKRRSWTPLTGDCTEGNGTEGTDKARNPFGDHHFDRGDLLTDLPYTEIMLHREAATNPDPRRSMKENQIIGMDRLSPQGANGSGAPDTLAYSAPRRCQFRLDRSA